MVDKKGVQEKPVKRWSRSKEMLRTLTVASLLAKFIDDNLTAHGLVDVLDEMALAVRVDNWKEVQASAPMVAFKAAPKDERVWVGLPPPERPWIVGCNPGCITTDTLYSLQDAKPIIDRTLVHIRNNVDAGRDSFDGMDTVDGLSSILRMLKGVILGDPVFLRGETWCGRVLQTEPIEGENSYPVPALVSFLFYEFLKSGGWKYLTRCAGCDRLFLPRRPDAHTCSPRCRKRKERQAD